MPHVPRPKRHPYDQWCPDARALDLVGDKWTLLIVRDLAAGPLRFVELQRVLPGISTEQLRSRLNRMVADGMLTRKRFREVPPRVDYALTERARDLMPVIGELARWGYEWAWSEPHPHETVQVDAIFRLAPGLSAAEGAAGTVQAEVTDGERCSYAFTLSSDGVTVEQGLSEDATGARITGTTGAWIDAFSHARDRGGLEISGQRELGEALLDGLCALGEADGSRDSQQRRAA
ncbi:MAG TPA: winged helix-turn-helix transcriptional regulator [Solirubrobacteraceae bacterium]